MARVVLTLLLMGAAGLGGFYAPQLFNIERPPFKTPFADPDQKYVKAFAPAVEYACKAVADSMVFEDRIGDPSEAVASAGAGRDDLALKASADGKNLLMLTAAAVKSGSSTAAEFPITALGSEYVIATAINGGTGSDTLVFNRKTMKLVWSRSGLLGFGELGGQSLLFRCL
jgi:hypothetical protein